MTPSRRTLGFLFADLRGYTSFVEARGDAAGAELLAQYRSLVRETVARFGGAEIKTEGDSFYVVFPSASSALECGLALVKDAASHARAADRPIRVGVGVHAGETVETDEGYVGSAVNIAARVCSVARAGEVCVTDTVRGLVRTSLPVHFVARGTPRLKGIRDPIAVYTVIPGPSPAPTIRSGLPLLAGRAGRGLGLLVAAVMVAVAASLAGAALLARGPAPASTPPSARGQPASSTAPSSDDAVALPDGPLEPGTRYVTLFFRPTFSFVLPTSGWESADNTSDAVVLQAPASFAPGSEPALVFVTIRLVYDGGCGEANIKPLAGTFEETLAWLQRRAGWILEKTERVDVGGKAAARIDVRAGPAPRGCKEHPLFRTTSGSDHGLAPGERARFYVIDSGSEALTVMISGLVAREDGFEVAAGSVVQSVRFP